MDRYYFCMANWLKYGFILLMPMIFMACGGDGDGPDDEPGAEPDVEQPAITLEKYVDN